MTAHTRASTSPSPNTWPPNSAMRTSRSSSNRFAPKTRRSMLDNGQVDMVVASWPITDGSSAIVDFAGPYLTTSVGLLVRSDERGRFTNDAGSVGDVGDGTVCAVKGDETVGIFRGNPPAGPDSGAQQLCAVRHGRASRVGGCHSLRYGGAFRSSSGQRAPVYGRDCGQGRGQLWHRRESRHQPIGAENRGSIGRHG